MNGDKATTIDQSNRSSANESIHRFWPYVVPLLLWEVVFLVSSELIGHTAMTALVLHLVFYPAFFVAVVPFLFFKARMSYVGFVLLVFIGTYVVFSLTMLSLYALMGWELPIDLSLAES